MTLRGFIELHDAATGSEILVFVRNISTVSNPNNQAVVAVNERAPFTVKETYEQIGVLILQSDW